MVTVFAAIDHCTAECVGIHVVKKATRFEALEPIRQGVKEQFGAFSAGIAAGLWLRHDHGSVYLSDDFQNEIRFLGIEPSPASCASRKERMYRAHAQRTVTLDPTFSLTQLEQNLVSISSLAPVERYA